MAAALRPASSSQEFAGVFRNLCRRDTEDQMSRVLVTAQRRGWSRREPPSSESAEGARRAVGNLPGVKEGATKVAVCVSHSSQDSNNYIIFNELNGIPRRRGRARNWCKSRDTSLETLVGGFFSRDRGDPLCSVWTH